TALRHAEIRALADHTAIEFRSRRADRIVGPVAYPVVRLVRRPYISSDPAEPQKIDLHGQDRMHDLARRRLRLSEAEHRLCLGRESDLLRAAGKHAAALGDEGAVIVLPARARQPKEPRPLRKALFR